MNKITDMNITTKKIIEIENLDIQFLIKQSFFKKKARYLKALNKINLSVYQGETLGIVGESGSGKTTLARAISNLIHFTAPNSLIKGDIFYLKDKQKYHILKPLKAEQKYLREKIALIFQDPFSSLNPRHTIYEILAEPYKIFNKRLNQNEIVAKVQQLIQQVGISPNQLKKYPHQFSGGQKQRIAIARSIALSPELLIADEPVSALDVSIQAQILKMISDLKNKYGLTVIFIAHDIAVVSYISTKIAIMYKGNIVEIASSEKIIKHPKHPYTQLLISLVPKLKPRKKTPHIKHKYTSLSPNNLSCIYYNNCSARKKICQQIAPELKQIDKNHLIACHLY